MEEREGKLFCLTCDREVPREGEKDPRIRVVMDLDDQDVAIDIGFKKEW